MKLPCICKVCSLSFQAWRRDQYLCGSVLCRAEMKRRQSREWGRQHPEVVKERVRKWKAEHPEKVAEYATRQDPEVRRRAGRKYVARNFVKHRERLRLWRRSNPDKVAAQNRRNRGRRRGAEGSFTQAEWNLLTWLFRGRCAYCELELKLEPDHIIPVSKGGSNYIENLLPACRSCNSVKGDKVPVLVDDYWHFPSFTIKRV